MKHFLILTAIISSCILFTACNGGENAGAGSDENPTLKPHPEGVAEDTSGKTSGNMQRDTTQPYSPTSGSAYTNGDPTGSSMNRDSAAQGQLKNQSQPGPGSKMNTDRKSDNTTNASGGSGSTSAPKP